MDDVRSVSIGAICAFANDVDAETVTITWVTDEIKARLVTMEVTKYDPRPAWVRERDRADRARGE